MAEGTRLKIVDDKLQQNTSEIKELKSAFLELHGKTESHVNSLQSQFQTQISSLTDQVAHLASTIQNLTVSPHSSSPSDHTLATASRFRLDFPCFDGHDPSSWLHKADQFFASHQIPPHHHVPIASFHLDGQALAWWQWFSSRNPPPHWDCFTVELETRFGDSPFVDHMAALAKLNHHGSVQQYILDFELHSNKLPRLPDSYLLSLFIASFGT